MTVARESSTWKAINSNPSATTSRTCALKKIAAVTRRTAAAAEVQIVGRSHDVIVDFRTRVTSCAAHIGPR